MEKKLSEESVEKQSLESTTDQILSAGKAAVEKAQEAVEKAQEAVEKAQEEGGKFIESIAREGEKVKTQTQKLAEDTVEEVKGKVEDMKDRVEEVKSKASDTLDYLEQLFEERVSQVLNRLGIPTKDDFQDIAKRLQTLNENVQELVQASKLKATVGGVSSGPDDLKEISGVGPVIEAKLQADGVTTYRQIAELNAAEVERIETEVLKSSGRILREKWIGQAKELHRKKYGKRL